MKTILLLDTPERELEPLGRAFQAVAPEYALEYVFDRERLERHLAADGGIELVALEYEKGDGKSSGAEIIAAVRDRHNDALPVVAVAQAGNVEIVSEAIAAGATTFLVMGELLEERVATLMDKVRRISRIIDRNRRLATHNKQLLESAGEAFQIVGESAKIRKLVKKIEKVATVPRPVLIIGERGTGKELVARAIHAAGFAESAAARNGAAGAGQGGGHPAERPLVTVNCAAFAENLLESELFGHEKGAFTGAAEMTRGKFEQADGGTLFLDEIGSMSLSFQQKILRAVEYGVIVRVGGSREVPVDVRIIAATNADLEQKMRAGEFLRDLYDRLAFETIRVPPLRERQGDVDVLARHFLEQFMREIPAFQGKRLSPSALDALNVYDFPGNVRELKNIIERAAYRDVTSEITPEDLDMASILQQTAGGEAAADKEKAASASADPALETGTYEERVEAFKSRLIADALERSGGNQAQAARHLGLSYHQFRYHHRTLTTEE